MTEDELQKAVVAINTALLEGVDVGSISVDSYAGYVGFGPQWSIDLVNQHIGAANWRYEEIEEHGIADAWEFKGLLYLRVDGEWITKGSQVGGARTEKNITDGKKAARTDFLKKAFSAWSIGSPAYRGELSKFKNRRSAPPSPPAPGEKPASRERATNEQIEQIMALAKVIPGGLKTILEQFAPDVLSTTGGWRRDSLTWLKAKEILSALEDIGKPGDTPIANLQTRLAGTDDSPS